MVISEQEVRAYENPRGGAWQPVARHGICEGMGERQIECVPGMCIQRYGVDHRQRQVGKGCSGLKVRSWPEQGGPCHPGQAGDGRRRLSSSVA